MFFVLFPTYMIPGQATTFSYLQICEILFNTIPYANVLG